MKRTIVILGVAAAMAVAPSVASAATSAQKVKRTPAKPTAVLQTTVDDRSGQTIYRLGDPASGCSSRPQPRSVSRECPEGPLCSCCTPARPLPGSRTGFGSVPKQPRRRVGWPRRLRRSQPTRSTTPYESSGGFCRLLPPWRASPGLEHVRIGPSRFDVLSVTLDPARRRLPIVLPPRRNRSSWNVPGHRSDRRFR